jgi:hypothetical protein
LDEEQFLRELTYPELRRQYPQRLRRALRESNSSFRADYDSLVAEHDNQIRTSREHDVAINLCAYPFVETELPTTRLGYKFLRAAPLRELKVDNVDFLIYREGGKRPVAIFGEAKSSITNFPKTLSELSERRKTIDSNLDYIKREYLGGIDADPIIEYVLAVKTSFESKTRDAIMESDERIILWVVDYLESRELRLGQAPRGEPDRHLMTHHDQGLTKLLSTGIPSDGGTFAFYPQSHPIAKMSSLFAVKDETKHGLTISPHKLRSYCDVQLFYLTKDQREAEVQGIIAESLQTGLTVSDKERPELRIQSRFRKLASLEDDSKRRWISARLEQERLKRQTSAHDSVQASLLAEQAKIPRLI